MWAEDTGRPAVSCVSLSPLLLAQPVFGAPKSGTLSPSPGQPSSEQASSIFVLFVEREKVEREDLEHDPPKGFFLLSSRTPVRLNSLLYLPLFV